MGDEPDIRHDQRTLRNEVTVEDVVFHNPMGNSCRGNAVPSQRFRRNSVAVWQLGTVVHARKPATANDRVELGLGFLLDFWEEGHGEEEGMKRRHGLSKPQYESEPIRRGR